MRREVDRRVFASSIHLYIEFKPVALIKPLHARPLYRADMHECIGLAVIAVEKKEAPQRQLTGERATGTVKFFNGMKGFGFITRDDGQPDAFVHISAVERSGMSGLNEGDRLEFDIEVDRRGKYSAVNLTPHQG